MKTKVLGSEAACGTSTTNGSNFGSATVVRLYNSNASAQLVSIENSFPPCGSLKQRLPPS